MISDFYYSEQVISEFTLVLLEATGFYTVNYYTGGLMRFGKHQGCDFVFTDWAGLEGSNIVSLFYNEFCCLDSFSTCSSGRQSRGYCYNSLHKNSVNQKYRRDGWSWGYGKDFVEYCPVSFNHYESPDNIYYKGNCKYNYGNFGDVIGLDTGSEDPNEETHGEEGNIGTECSTGEVSPVGLTRENGAE